MKKTPKAQKAPLTKAQATKKALPTEGEKPARKVATKAEETARKETVPGDKAGPRVGAKGDGFFIVGMGASAGGLEAIEKFLRHMPSDSGLCFVLVPHLDPDHKSMMGDLLSRYTKMKIFQAEEGMRVRPDAIYIIPPNREMTIREGRLRLFELKEKRGIRHPIDFFFRSLAEDRGEYAIGIVLSGTGSEGALGLRAIKGAGGLPLVQDTATASYVGMPESAIGTGIIDFVLPPEKMAGALVTYAKQTGKAIVPPPEKEKEEPKNFLQKVLGIVRAQTGVDFSLYKTNTIVRRIEKRMAMYQIQSLEDYLAYLRSSPHEVNALLKEILIRVTNFFRDAPAFDVIKNEVMPQLFMGKSEDNPLRIWVPGCSTGEEAYSLAIVIREAMEAAQKMFPVQIIATDIDSGAIDIARSGAYADSVTADISPERLARYFIKQGSAFKVRGELREMVIFAVHNILKDPPFLKLDLVSCRNVLIYMGSELQKKVIPMLRYSLHSEGFLFLGPAENIGEFTDLFSIVDKRWKVFRCRRGDKVAPVDIGLHRAVVRKAQAHPKRPAAAAMRTDVSLAELTESMLLNEFAPPCVIVNENGDVVYFHGKTGRYLEPPPGKASLKVVDMAKEGLRLELMSCLRRAISRKEKVSSRGLQVKTNGGFETVDLEVRYIKKPDYLEGLVMVVFKPLPQPKADKIPAKKSIEADRLTKHVSELEYELKSTKEHLQTTIEELETSNEELKSANEELQSSNEELETSREELQSVNEELVTVNAEYGGKIEALSSANDDMKNLLASANIATIFVDEGLKIKRFTPSAAEIVNLIDSDLGRPLRDISPRVEYPGLTADVKASIESLATKIRTVRHEGGRWYMAKVTPYRTAENVIDGAVITFTDITEQKQAQEQLDAARTFESVVQHISEPILLLDQDLTVEFANAAFYQVFKTSEEYTVKRRVYDLGNGQWNIAALRKLLEKILPEKKSLRNYVVEHDFEYIGLKKMVLDANLIFSERAASERILLTINEVTGKG